MKTAEELNALKEEVKAMNAKLHELTEEELTLVAGGFGGSNGQWNDGDLVSARGLSDNVYYFGRLRIDKYYDGEIHYVVQCGRTAIGYMSYWNVRDYSGSAVFYPNNPMLGYLAKKIYSLPEAGRQSNEYMSEFI